MMQYFLCEIMFVMTSAGLPSTEAAAAAVVVSEELHHGRRDLQQQVQAEEEWTTTSDICTNDSHCLNNGKCLQPTSDIPFRHCQCQNNYSGHRCSRFCPFDCQNGGICRSTPQGSAMGLKEKDYSNNNNSDEYYCKCHGHYTGLLCEIPYMNCGEQEKRCYNGGHCVLDDTNLIHHCSCKEGYGGPSCEDEFSSFGNNLEAASSAASSSSSNLTEEGKTTTITVVSILLFFLGATLFILLRKKRLAVPPKFITIEDDCFPDNGDNQKNYHSNGMTYYGDCDTHTSGRIMLNVI